MNLLLLFARLHACWCLDVILTLLDSRRLWLSLTVPHRGQRPVGERENFAAAIGAKNLEWRSLEFTGPFYRHPRTSQTLKNTSSAGGIFRRWLSGEPHTDSRPIREIPPEVLDGYLCDFFKNVKKRDGRNYNPESFNTLRLSLNRYLNKEGFDSFTLRSAIFNRSRQAFSERKMELSADIQQENPSS